MIDSEQAYRTYQQELIYYAVGLVGPWDAGDVLTDAALRAFSSPDWPHVASPRSYLYRTVYAVAGDNYRDVLASRLQALGSGDRFTGDPPVLTALERLSLEERAALYLIHGVGLKPGQVAAQLGVSIPAVNRYLGSAQRKLGVNVTGDEEKANRFLRRVVATSPSPPEFPDRDHGGVSRGRYRNARLTMGVTAAAVALLIAPFFFVGGATTRANVTTTISERPPPGAVAFSGVVYLVQDPQNSVSGHPALVPFEVIAFDETGVLDEDDDDVAFLTKLTDLNVRLPSDAATPEDTPTIVFYSMVPSGTRVEEVSTVEWLGKQVLVLDMHGDFADGAGEEAADITMLNQLIYTATEGNPDLRVWFTIEGRPLEVFGSDGLDLSTPVGRDTFRENLNPIILTAPVVADIEDQTISVAGLANVFEGTVSYRVPSPQIGIARSGATTATCGTGCWGRFELTLPAGDIFSGGSIQIFEESAQDGFPTNLIEMVMPAGFDGRWNLSR